MYCEPTCIASLLHVCIASLLHVRVLRAFYMYCEPSTCIASHLHVHVTAIGASEATPLVLFFIRTCRSTLPPSPHRPCHHPLTDPATIPHSSAPGVPPVHRRRRLRAASSTARISSSTSASRTPAVMADPVRAGLVGRRARPGSSARTVARPGDEGSTEGCFRTHSTSRSTRTS